MTIQQILERLLRSKLYRKGILIQTDVGESEAVLVHDVRYQGSKSFVVVAEKAQPDAEFCIPLVRIRRIRSADEAA